MSGLTIVTRRRDGSTRSSANWSPTSTKSITWRLRSACSESPMRRSNRSSGTSRRSSCCFRNWRAKQRAGKATKFFLASSSEVYGKNPKSTWTEEDDIVLGPTTHMRWSYGASKAIDEFLTLAYHRQHGLPVVVGRFFNVVGPRQTGRYGMVLPRFVDSALAGKPPIVHDDGRQVRCFAHVADVCRMVVALMATPAAVGQVFNIGSDVPVSILELAKRVLAVVDPSLEIEFQSYRDAYSDDFEDVRRRVPDFDQAANRDRRGAAAGPGCGDSRRGGVEERHAGAASPFSKPGD